MNKSAKQSAESELKSLINQSHNSNSQPANDRLRALVKFLARKAAEEDYRALLERTNFSRIKGEEQ